jgi:hypothetical protein
MRTGLLIRIIYALCLLGATVNHVRAVHAHGWMPPDLPWGTAVYWSSLTFLEVQSWSPSHGITFP